MSHCKGNGSLYSLGVFPAFGIFLVNPNLYVTSDGERDSLNKQPLGARERNEVCLAKFFCNKHRNGRYALRVKSLQLMAAILLAAGLPAYCQDPGAGSDSDAAVGVALGIPSPTTRAAAELRAQEQQRILGAMPEFNVTNVHDAAALSPGQKFQLALKGETDPFAFVAAGLAAGLGQWEKSSPSYGYGAQGYGKRFGAAYMDAFDGAIFGNAVFPVLLHQDPRYFRQGVGSFESRFLHAVSSTWRSKNDDGHWTWNYSNLLGNLAAGGISNLYYSPADRGASPTFQRALTVTAEGAIGAVFFEFWPDLNRKFLSRKNKGQD